MSCYSHIPIMNIDTPKLDSYIKVYTSLLTCAPSLGINIDDVYAYALLVDRASVSARNGWTDDNGRVYVIYSHPQFSAATGWSRDKVISTFKRLTSAGLITQEAQTNTIGCSVPNRIYVKQWSPPSINLTVVDIQNGQLNDITRSNASVISDNYIELPRTPTLRELPVRAQMLYAILLSKINVSLDYGCIDPDGNAWCVLDADNAMQTLGCGKTALCNAYTVLSNCGLIERVRVGYGLSVRTYLRPVWMATDDTAAHDHENTPSINPPTTPQLTANTTPSRPLTTPQSADTDTQIKTTKLTPHSHLQAVSIRARDASDVRAEIFEQLVPNQIAIDVTQLLPPTDAEMAIQILNRAICIMTTDTLYPGRKIRINGSLVHKDDVLLAYSRIDRYIMAVMIVKIVAAWPNVRNPDGYIRSALLHAVANHADEAYYMQQQLA